MINKMDSSKMSSRMFKSQKMTFKTFQELLIMKESIERLKIHLLKY
jgi:hypothetical protein